MSSYLVVPRKVIFSCRVCEIMSQMWISKTVVCGYIIGMPFLEETWLAMFSRLTAAKRHFVLYFLYYNNQSNVILWSIIYVTWIIWTMFCKSVLLPHSFNDSNFAIWGRNFLFLLYFNKCTYYHSRIEHGRTFNIHERICYIDIIISLAAIKFYGTCVVSNIFKTHNNFFK